MDLLLGNKEISLFFKNTLNNFIIPSLSNFLPQGIIQSFDDQTLIDENGFYLTLKLEGE